jgi:phage shock protein A
MRKSFALSATSGRVSRLFLRFAPRNSRRWNGKAEIMALWKKLQRLLHHKVQKELSQVEDPDTLLLQAQEEMRTAAARNRERAVYAITQKNSLEAMVGDLRRTLDHLGEEAEIADRLGDSVKASHLREEAARHFHSLRESEAMLQAAIEVSEQVKTAIRCEEERIRQKSAEALALRSQWHVLKIEQTLVRLMAEQSAGIRTPMSEGEVASRREKVEAQANEAMLFREQLAWMVKTATEQVETLKSKANSARDANDETLERALVRLMEQHEATLESAQVALAKADVVAERAQALLHEETAWQSLQGALVREGLKEPAATRKSSDPDRKVAGMLVLALLILMALVLVFWMLR